MRILILVGEGFEDLELFYPLYRVKEEGYKVDVASKNRGKVTGKHGYSVEANLSFDEVDVEKYDSLILPGGRGPERIRIYKRAVEIVKHFVEAGKPIAAICHGPQLLISARSIKGRRMTSWYGIKDDVIVAGGIWEDKPVVVDGNLVTARHPGDLADWMREYIALLRKMHRG